MRKILVEVLVPASGNRYDFLLRTDVKVRDFTCAITDVIVEYEKGNIDFSNDFPVLCDLSHQKALPLDGTLSSLCIRDGCTLLLV